MVENQINQFSVYINLCDPGFNMIAIFYKLKYQKTEKTESKSRLNAYNLDHKINEMAESNIL